MTTQKFTVFTSGTPGDIREVCDRLEGGAQEICRIVDDILGASGMQLGGNLLTLQDKQELSEILELRKNILSQNNSETVLSVDTPDYLPISFLERGLRCGAAVCIIRRKFNLVDLYERMKQRKVKDFPAIMQTMADEHFEPLGGWKNDDISTLCQIFDMSPELRYRYKENPKVRIPFATGFLVGPEHLLTNYHVFFDDKNGEELNDEKLKQFVAEFRYERNAADNDRQPRTYSFNSIYAADKDLDYILIKLNYPSPKFPGEPSAPGQIFGWLPMHQDPHLVMPRIDQKKVTEFQLDSKLLRRRSEIPGDPVFIIQHPRGRQKEIVMFNNQVQELYEDFFQYQADADFGSSGSPVLDRDWKLVGLHHASLLQWIDNDIEVLGNLGARISRICSSLEKNKQEWVQTFIKRYIVQKNKISSKGTVFISIGRDRRTNSDGTDFLGSEKGEMELRGMNVLKQELQKNFPNSQKSGINFKLVPDEYLCSTDGPIDWINEQGYSLGDISIEIVMDSRDKIITKPNEKTKIKPNKKSHISASIYYYRYLIDRRSHAEIIMQAIRSKVPEILNRGVNSDLTSGPGSIGFCSRVHMPSLVLFLGNVDDSENITFIEENKTKIAIGLLDGVTAWVKTLSPYGFW